MGVIIDHLSDFYFILILTYSVFKSQYEEVQILILGARIFGEVADNHREPKRLSTEATHSATSSVPFTVASFAPPGVAVKGRVVRVVTLKKRLVNQSTLVMGFSL